METEVTEENPVPEARPGIKEKGKIEVKEIETEADDKKEARQYEVQTFTARFMTLKLSMW